MNTKLKLIALSAISTFVITNAASVEAVTTKKVSPTSTKTAAIAGLSQYDDKAFTFYYPKAYKSSKNSYYKYYYRNPTANEYGLYDGIGMTVKKIGQALPEPKTEDCKIIEKTLQKDIQKSLATAKNVKITPYSMRTFKKDNFAKDPKKRVVQYGCRIEYQIQVGTVSLFSQIKVANKKGQKDLYVIGTLYSDQTEYEEVRALEKAFDSFMVK